MDYRYYTDPVTALPHIYDHGVTEAEVEFVLRNPVEEIDIPNGARSCIGQTVSGRYLRVIYSPDDDGFGVFIVTAYPIRGKQLKAYRRRRRKRHGK